MDHSNSNLAIESSVAQNAALQAVTASKIGLLVPTVVSTLVVAGIAVAISVPIAVSTENKNKNGKTFGIYNMSKPELEYEYGCFVDAGSSSSRVFIYSWPKTETNIIPEITQLNKSDKYYPALGKPKIIKK